MPRSSPIFAIALACLAASSLAAGCSPGDVVDTSRSRVTMYLAETDPERCVEMARDPGDAIVNDAVEIGSYAYTHYPESGLVCRADGEGGQLAAFTPESIRTATHRWVTETGFGTLGEKHTFGPVPDERPQP